jgi:hypothetical protein
MNEVVAYGTAVKLARPDRGMTGGARLAALVTAGLAAVGGIALHLVTGHGWGLIGLAAVIALATVFERRYRARGPKATSPGNAPVNVKWTWRPALWWKCGTIRSPARASMSRWRIDRGQSSDLNRCT